MAWVKVGNIRGPQGSQGDPGNSITGPQGLSAYQVALAAGFVGTEAQWLASLVGPQGDPGSQYLFGGTLPDASLGVNGDVYQNTATGDQYKKVAGSWVYRGTLAGVGGGGSTEVVNGVACDSTVFIGAAVRMSASGVTEVNMNLWASMAGLPSLNVTSYTSVAVNALADSFAHSNVFGIVESKSSPTVCSIRVSGVSLPIYVGLDVTEEYYLSDVYPGHIVPLVSAPSTPGTILLRIGQPYSPDRFFFQRGDRIVRGA